MEIDEYGIGRCWLATIQLVSERRRQECKDSHGTGAA